MQDERGAEPRGALALLCGLPAAGKSTLARRVLQDGPSELASRCGGGGSVRVQHICFDDIHAELQAERGAVGFDPALWRESRERAFAQACAAVEDCSARADVWESGGVGCCSGEVGGEVSGSEAQTTCASRTRVLVLLDDNMHYRSMRRAYYRLARSAGLGLCTVCVEVELGEALRRDALRPAALRVGEPTLRHMAEVLQWPQAEVRGWERLVGHASACGEPPWDTLVRSLAQHAAAPPPELSALAAEAAESAAQTASSVAHQLDLRLRRTMAARMQSDEVMRLPAEQRAKLARRLSELKRQVACPGVGCVSVKCAWLSELNNNNLRKKTVLSGYCSMN